MSTILVTGGASGIGFACAQDLAVRGYQVGLLDHDSDALEAAAGRLRAAGYSPDARAVDVTDAAAIDEAIRSFTGGPPIRGVVNAAGIYQRGTALDVDEGSWDRVIDVNLKGTFLVSRAVIPLLVAAGGGSIVNLSSQSGRTKSQFAAPSYSASKGGIIGLSMTLAAQHGREGVRVNCVAPGVIDTPMTRDSYSVDERVAMLAAIPLNRFGSAAEVAAVVSFLISDSASYVTGQTINVNGGGWML